MQHVLTAVLYLPLAAALVLALLPRGQETVIKYLALMASLASFFLSLLLWVNFAWGANEQFQFVTSVRWVPELGIRYKTGVDGISLVLVVLTTLLSWIAVLSSFTAITTRVKEYYITLLVLETGMLGVFVALDLIVFYVFWEAMLIPMYFLIGIWGGPRRVYATIKFVLFTLVGSLLMLIGILAIHAAVPHPEALGGLGGPGAAGTFDLVYILQNHAGIIDVLPTSAQFWIFFSFALAFAIKVPMWPLHTWLPHAHVEAPTAGSVLLAGVLLKMGTYGFVRFCLPLFPGICLQVAPFMAVLAVIGIIYGALMALVQRDIKKLVAYSSVSHLGFCMLGIFAFTQAGVEGAVLQMINHGLGTGALFLIVGMIYERRHTREISEFGGLWKVMPVYAAFFLIITLSSIGLPGLNGFIGEFMILVGSWLGRGWQTTAWAATGIILGACYMLWMFQRVMQGPLTNPENRSLRDLDSREVWTLVPIVALIFAIGIFPNSMLKYFDRAVALNVLVPIQTAQEARREGGGVRVADSRLTPPQPITHCVGTRGYPRSGCGGVRRGSQPPQRLTPSIHEPSTH
jgi:NADH-quinone oxidoreductase subunit M